MLGNCNRLLLHPRSFIIHYLRGICGHLISSIFGFERSANYNNFY